MTLDKQAYTFPAKETTEPLCQGCKFFDETKSRNLGAKGHCEDRNVPIFRFDFDVCVGRKKKKELKE